MKICYPRLKHYHARPSGLLLLLSREQDICTNTTRKSRGERLRLYISLQVGNALPEMYAQLQRTLQCTSGAGRSKITGRVCFIRVVSLAKKPTHSRLHHLLPHFLPGTHAWVEDPVEARNVNAHPKTRPRVHGATTWRKTPGTSILIFRLLLETYKQMAWACRLPSCFLNFLKRKS